MRIVQVVKVQKLLVLLLFLVDSLFSLDQTAIIQIVDKFGVIKQRTIHIIGPPHFVSHAISSFVKQDVSVVGAHLTTAIVEYVRVVRLTIHKLNAIRIVKAVPSRVDHVLTKRRVMSIRHVLALVIANCEQIVNVVVVDGVAFVFDQIVAYVQTARGKPHGRGEFGIGRVRLVEEAFQMDDEYGRSRGDRKFLVRIALFLAIRTHPRVLVGQLFGLCEQFETVVQRDGRRLICLV